MPWIVPDHPDIISCERTGYPSWNQPDPHVYCEICGKDITYEDKIDIADHEVMCVSCWIDRLVEEE